MQAIVTKYLGATNHHGSRILVKAQAGRITVSWDDALDVDENHKAAAAAFAKKWGWTGKLIGGGLPDGTGYAFCFTNAVTSYLEVEVSK